MIHVVGEILVDIFRDGKDEQVFPGGAPFNVASNVKHFGGNSTFYGAVGKDDYGSFLKKFSRKQKFNSLILKSLSTRDTTEAVVTLSNGERSFKFVRENGADYALSIKNLEKLGIAKGDIVHIGSLMLSFSRGRRFFYKAVGFAKQKGALISFDINYRDDIFESENQARRIFKKAMGVADILKISDEELSVLSKKKTFKGQVKDLVKENQIAFISQGSKGSTMVSKEIFISESTKPINPIDTTGAGDAFYSYILYEYDKNNSFIKAEKSVKEVLKKANAVGALVTQKKGAVGVVPSLKELEKYLGE